jgi:hypothetical protein
MQRPAPSFAMLAQCWPSAGTGRSQTFAQRNGWTGQRFATDAGRTQADARWLQPIQLEVDDLEGEVDRLRKAGARFRNSIVTGFGGKQSLLDDPAGTPIELFEPLFEPPRR